MPKLKRNKTTSRKKHDPYNTDNTDLSAMNTEDNMPLSLSISSLRENIEDKLSSYEFTLDELKHILNDSCGLNTSGRYEFANISGNELTFLHKVDSLLDEFILVPTTSSGTSRKRIRTSRTGANNHSNDDDLQRPSKKNKMLVNGSAHERDNSVKGKLSQLATTQDKTIMSQQNEGYSKTIRNKLERSSKSKGGGGFQRMALVPRRKGETTKGDYGGSKKYKSDCMTKNDSTNSTSQSAYFESYKKAMKEEIEAKILKKSNGVDTLNQIILDKLIVLEKYHHDREMSFTTPSGALDGNRNSSEIILNNDMSINSGSNLDSSSTTKSQNKEDTKSNSNSSLNNVLDLSNKPKDTLEGTSFPNLANLEPGAPTAPFAGPKTHVKGNADYKSTPVVGLNVVPSLSSTTLDSKTTPALSSLGAKFPFPAPSTDLSGKEKLASTLPSFPATSTTLDSKTTPALSSLGAKFPFPAPSTDLSGKEKAASTLPSFPATSTTLDSKTTPGFGQDFTFSASNTGQPGKEVFVQPSSTATLPYDSSKISFKFGPPSTAGKAGLGAAVDNDGFGPVKYGFGSVDNKASGKQESSDSPFALLNASNQIQSNSTFGTSSKFPGIPGGDGGINLTNFTTPVANHGSTNNRFVSNSGFVPNNGGASIANFGTNVGTATTNNGFGTATTNNGFGAANSGMFLQGNGLSGFGTTPAPPPLNFSSGVGLETPLIGTQRKIMKARMKIRKRR